MALKKAASKDANAARAKRPPAARRKTTGASVRVRMYNVGFGDAFLLEFPSEGRPRRVLIDCGTVANPQGHRLEDIVGRLIDDCGGDSAEIDVVVATHRHKDHVEGFKDPRWNEVAVREVWMPWTEDPKDKEATEIRETQAGMARALERTFALRVADPDEDPWLGLAINALSNETAMAMLHRGFDGKPKRRFLAVGEKGPTVVESDALPGVLVHVLGPSRDQEIIRDMNPPKGKTFLSQVGEEGLAHEPIDPFGEAWWLSEEELNNDLLHHLRVSDGDAKAIAAQSLATDPLIAVALESAVNGTSLVLLFECGDAYLLFAGDAQWGTWDRILRDHDARQLLSRVNFFKVGHHGSHNATPIEFVENYFSPNCCAMVSTLETKRWKSIPRGPLIEALKARSRIFARSDQPDAANRSFQLFEKQVTEYKVKC